MPIDYERMKRVFPKQKAALTRARKIGYSKVLAVVIDAITEWDAIGAWPDNWAHWQRALDDAAYAQNRLRYDSLAHQTLPHVEAPRMGTL
jgi:hypothetical protein